MHNWHWRERAEALLRSIAPHRMPSYKEVSDLAELLRKTDEIMDTIPFVEAASERLRREAQ